MFAPAGEFLSKNRGIDPLPLKKDETELSLQLRHPASNHSNPSQKWTCVSLLTVLSRHHDTLFAAREIGFYKFLTLAALWISCG
jgi:hypothetical protein